jgi:hypothetical protein
LEDVSISTFFDDFSQMTWVIFPKENLEAFEKFKNFRHLVDNATKEFFYTLRIDNGGEFTSNEFKDYHKDKEIRRQLTNSYSRQQNGVLERRIRTLMGVARSMLKFKGFSSSYWA